LDVHRHLATEIALDLELGLEDVADATDLVLVEAVGPLVERDVSLLQDLPAQRLADPVDVRERNLHPLVAREVDACDTSHGLALPLLVLGVVRADHAHDALAPDDLALVTNLLDRRSHFHVFTLSTMVPRFGSFSARLTFTRSPALIGPDTLRNSSATCAVIVSFSSLTFTNAPGRSSTTVPTSAFTLD